MPDDDDVLLKVVVNDEEQYSIWPVDRPNALGWHDAGFTGTKDDCLHHISSVWTDMRPRSLRDAMSADSSSPPHDSAPG